MESVGEVELSMPLVTCVEGAVGDGRRAACAMHAVRVKARNCQLRVGPLPSWLGRRCPAALQDECECSVSGEGCRPWGRERAHLLRTSASTGQMRLRSCRGSNASEASCSSRCAGGQADRSDTAIGCMQ